MDDQSVIVLAILKVSQIAGLMILPVVATSFVWLGLRRAAPRDFFAIPVVHTLAKWVGLGLGLVLISVHQSPRQHDLHVIFLPDSPWNISVGEFLLRHTNPINYGPVDVVIQLVKGDSGMLGWVVASLGVLLAVAIGYSWKIWPVKLAGRATLCIAVIVLWIAYVTIYGVSLLFWLLFLLNSWTFLLLAVVLYYYRQRN